MMRASPKARVLFIATLWLSLKHDTGAAEPGAKLLLPKVTLPHCPVFPAGWTKANGTMDGNCSGRSAQGAIP
jgi:hypothetical protein